MNIREFIINLQKEIKKQEGVIEQEKRLEQLKEKARKYEGDDQVISSEEFIKKIKSRPEEEKLKTGFRDLDYILDGFRLNQLVTLCGPTKTGKTTFAMELTIRMREHNPMWIPFEEGAEELITKFLDRKEQPPQFYTPEHLTSKTINWIEQKIVESIAKYNTKVVFIDHLHFIVPFTVERHDLAVGRTMRELKGLAKRWNVCIFILAHLKKTKLTEQPTLEDIRDSSFVAQESDTVMMIWRRSKRVNGKMEITNDSGLSIQANRRTGKTGNIEMVFKDGRFLEKAWEVEHYDY
jgi:replicative DNA helicase